MRAGDLRHRVTIQRETVEGDTVSFADVATVWAAVRTPGGREFYIAKRLTPELTHEVEMRYRADLSAGMRIIHGDAVLHVEAAPDPEGRRRRTLAFCKQLVQAAP